MIPGNANPLLLASAAADAAAAGPIKSVRFNNDDSAYLNRTPSSAGNRKTWTFSCWVKRSELTTGSANSRGLLAVQDGIDDNNYFEFRFIDNKINIAGYSTVFRRTDVLYRDVSAWYHIVLAVDTTSSTADDRIKLYVNGVEVDDFGAKNNPSQNADLAINKAASHTLGSNGTSAYFDGYIADCFLIDGQQLDPTSFGAFDDNGVWQSAAYSGTFGTNGFHIFDFANESGIGNDSSGNDNDFTVNNLQADGLFVNQGFTNPGNAFDGNTGTYAEVATSAALGQFIFPGGISVSSSVKIKYSSGTSGNVYLNGNATALAGTGTQEHNITFSGTLNYIGIQSSSKPVIYYVDIDNNGTYLTGGAAKDQDVLFDVPTNGSQSDSGAGGEVSGCYATWNPLFGENNSLSNGNLNAQAPASGYAIIASTLAMTSGKWYMEYHYTSNANSDGDGGNYITFGVSQTNRDGEEGSGVSDTAEDFGFKCHKNGFNSQTNGQNQHNYSSSVNTGDILSLAFDADAGKLWVAKNGTWMTNASGTGDPANGNNPDFSSLTYSGGYFFMAGPYNSDSLSAELEANFGARPWAYSAPSGFKALNTASLPTPTIADGSNYFQTKLITGNNSTQAITTTSMSPDFVWLKRRNQGTYSHSLVDSVRGASKRLASEGTYAEDTFAAVSSFDSEGFTLGNTILNETGASTVAWAWDAGANSSKTYTVKVVSDSGNKYRFDDFGTSAVTLDLEEGSTYVFDQSDSSNSGHPLRFSTTSDGTHNSGSEYTTGVTTTGTPGSAGAKTTIVVGSGVATLYYYCSAHSGMGGQANTNSTAGASNFDGSIQATVRANQTAGFSIVTYTGNGTQDATVGHGLLNATPDFVITKNRTTANYWAVHHSGLASGHYLRLNLNMASEAASHYWVSFSSSVMTMNDTGTALNNINNSSDDYVSYCFTSVAGYSAFGSYEGNGNADGPFVYTGFRVKWLMARRVENAVANWLITDAARSPYNVIDKLLTANTSGAEDTYTQVDFLSNGFKIRNTGPFMNASGDKHIYIAFAENPFSSNGGLAR